MDSGTSGGAASYGSASLPSPLRSIPIPYRIRYRRTIPGNTGARPTANHKVKAATVLFVLWLLMLGCAVVLVLSGADVGSLQFNLKGGGLAPVMAFIGTVAGLYIVRKQNATGNHTENV